MPVVGFLSLELHMPGARSLKDKRVVLRSLKDRLRALNVAVAESDEHAPVWQRAHLSIVAVADRQQRVERSLEKVWKKSSGRVRASSSLRKSNGSDKRPGHVAGSKVERCLREHDSTAWGPHPRRARCAVDPFRA